jgi:hypothetical protein
LKRGRRASENEGSANVTGGISGAI